MRKPIAVINPEFLECAAARDSRRADYFNYRDGKISEQEFVADLPHVALIGDSVSTGVHISSAIGTLWRVRNYLPGSWFLDTNSSSESVQSVSKKLAELTPFVARELAGIGAMIDRENERPTFSRRVLGTRNFSGQVTELLRTERFPDLVLILIGHNNVDWTWWTQGEAAANSGADLERQSVKIRRNFAREFQRLIDHALAQPHEVAIVVYGLVNFGTYFNARRAAENLRKQDRRLYPHLETTYRHINSFRPAYRDNLIRLAILLNDELRMMVDAINARIPATGKIDLRYSSAMATADLSRVELLHAVDGWHPSIEGHNVLAKAAFDDLGPSLEFLGIA